MKSSMLFFGNHWQDAEGIVFMNVNHVEFILSAASPSQFIFDSRKKIAFAGRSNVGKSSVINRLLNRKQMAKVGSMPGKTVHINYFLIDQRVYFVDLPGYGYAQVSLQEKERWGKLMESFFTQPNAFHYGVLIVDSRHKPTQQDLDMASFFLDSGKKTAVVANKVDKCRKSEIEDNMAVISDYLHLPNSIPLIPFSSVTGIGREELLRFILS